MATSKEHGALGCRGSVGPAAGQSRPESTHSGCSERGVWRRAASVKKTVLLSSWLGAAVLLVQRLTLCDEPDSAEPKVGVQSAWRWPAFPEARRCFPRSRTFASRLMAAPYSTC